MSNWDTKSANIWVLAVNSSKIVDREVDFRERNIVTPVSQHLQNGSTWQVVSVTVSAALVHQAAKAISHCLFSFKPIAFHLLTLTLTLTEEI